MHVYMYVCVQKLPELASCFLNLDKTYCLVIPYIPELCLSVGPQAPCCATSGTSVMMC